MTTMLDHTEPQVPPNRPKPPPPAPDALPIREPVREPDQPGPHEHPDPVGEPPADRPPVVGHVCISSQQAAWATRCGWLQVGAAPRRVTP